MNFKKILAMTMASAMMLSVLNGCGNSSQTDNAVQESSSENTAETSDEVSVDTEVSDEGETAGTALSAIELYENGIQDYKYKAGELKSYDEPLHLTFGRSIDLNAENWLEMAELGEPLENNRWIQYYKEALNVECEYVMTNSGSGDYGQELVLAMASGNLPDVFLISDQSMISQLADGGLIWDMTEIYQNNANETLGNAIESEGSNVYSSGMYDGKLYAIPQKMPSTNSYNYCWVRRDWLEEQGLDLPETMDDVKEIAQTFKNNYEDNIGFMFSNSYGWANQGIFWAFGGSESEKRNQWVMQEDGSLAYAEVLPEMKGGLTWLNDMYESNLINMEWATEDLFTALSNYVATNRCGIFYGPHWLGNTLQSYAESMDDSADWVPCGPPTGIEGMTVKIAAVNTVDNWVCVSKSCENPEAVIHMLNAYVEKLFGENNDFENFFACELDSSLWQATPIWCLTGTTDLDPCLNMIENYDEAAGTMNEDGLEGAGKTYWNYIQDGMSAYQYMFGPVDSCFKYVSETYPQNVSWNAYIGAPTPTYIERWGSMTELIDTYYLKMINGEIEIETGFDQMVNEWYEMGGTQVTAEVNEAYLELNK